MKFIKIFVLIILVLVLVFISFSVYMENSKFPDSLALRKLFINKNFEKLNAKITTYQKQYEADITREIAFQLIFDTFENPDPSYEALFNEWIKQNPTSYIPLFARGRYFINMGWYKRGKKWASKTSDSQFEQFHYYLTKAMEDINKAISINPELSILYAEKIEVAKGLSDHKAKLKVLNEGLKINPASYEIRKTYLFSILPRWGGSFKEIEEFLAETKKHENENPNLKPLAGFIEYEKALIAKENKQYEKGIKLLTKAIEYGDKHWFYTTRATCYFFLNNYDKALSDLNVSLQIDPESVDALYWRSWVYRKQEMYAKALTDLDLAARLEPYSFKVIKNRAHVFVSLNQFEKAVDGFKKALTLDNKHSETWSYLGWYSAYKLKDYNSAFNAYKQATILAPNNTSYLYSYALVLNDKRDCKMMSVLKKYVKLCKIERTKPCTAENVNWAKEMSIYLTSNNICSK